MTGLMSPIPSRTRAEYDEAARRASGWGGLLSAVAEPLSWIPGPVGDAAQVAANIGEQGPMQGLMASWDVVGLPKVLRQGPKVLKMYDRVKTSPELRTHLQALATDIHSPEARRFAEKTGTVIDVAGNMVREIPDDKAAATRYLAQALGDLTKAKDPRKFVTARAGELLAHPELYARHPDLAQIPVTMSIDPRRKGGTFGGSFNREGNRVSLDVPTGDFQPPELVLLHELQHALQQKSGLPQGANNSAIETNLVQALQHYNATPEEIMNLRDKIKFEALNRYLLTEGEIGARTAEKRWKLTPQERRDSYFHDTERFRDGSVIPSESRVLAPYDQAAIERIARRLLGIPAAPPSGQ